LLQQTLKAFKLLNKLHFERDFVKIGSVCSLLDYWDICCGCNPCCTHYTMGNLLGAPVVDKETHEGATSEGILFAVSTMQGWRVHMEDAHIMEANLYADERVVADDDSSKPVYVQIPLSGHALFAVFDGHGGTFAALYSCRNFCRVLARQPSFVKYAKWWTQEQERNTHEQQPQDATALNNKNQEGLDLLENALMSTFVDLDREIACALKSSPVDNADDPYHDASHGTTGGAAVAAASHGDDAEDDDVGSPADSALKRLEEEGDSGTTACVVLLTPQYIVCANAGDSRAVLSRKQATGAGSTTSSTAASDLSADSMASSNADAMKTVIPLSYDHKPEDMEEESRIRAAGGYVSGGRVEGDLALSRALGDYRFKNMDTVMGGTAALQEQSNPENATTATRLMRPGDQKVSPVPDITIHARNPQLDEFIIVACDGIWDVQTNYEGIQMVSSIFNEGESVLGLVCEEVSFVWHSLSFERFCWSYQSPCSVIMPQTKFSLFVRFWMSALPKEARTT
jgi:serine/threonine protein phosphatase PrpC